MENTDRFVELSRSFPWAFKLRKSYKRLLKAHTHEEKLEIMDKWIVRAVKILGKHIGDNADSFEEMKDLSTTQSFLKELIIVLNVENSKLHDEFKNFDSRIQPIISKYLYIYDYFMNLEEASKQQEVMKGFFKFLKSLPQHPQSTISKKGRAISLLAESQKSATSTPPSRCKSKSILDKRVDTPMPPRRQVTHSETSPQEDIDPDSTLTLETTNFPGHVTPSTPNTPSTSSVMKNENTEKKLETPTIDSEEVDISDTAKEAPGEESTIEITSNELEKRENEVQEADCQNDDADILPPSPTSSSSSRIFSSTKVSFSRCLILPQGIVTREEVKQSSPRYVAETPEPPISVDSQGGETEIIETVALIHPPPPSSIMPDFDSIEGISPIIWEKSGINDDDDVNSTQDNGIHASPSIDTIINCPIQESNRIPLKHEEAPVHSADDSISLVNSKPASDPFRDLPVQLSAIQALLRKRFRNPFITPTEKLLYKFQRRLGRMKRQPPRPVWIVTKRRTSAYPPKVDNNNNLPLRQIDKNEFISSSQSLLTNELDRSLRNLEHEEDGNANGEEFLIRQPLSSQDAMNANSAGELKAELCDASSDQVSCVKEEPTISMATLINGRHSPDSGCEVQIGETSLVGKIEPETTVKESIGDGSPIEPVAFVTTESGDVPKAADEATTCDLLGCSSSESDAEIMDEIKSNIAAWVSQNEEPIKESILDEGQPPLSLFSFSSPTDGIEPDIKLVEQRTKSTSPIISQSPKQKYLRRSVRLASLQNASLSSIGSSSGTASRKRRALPSSSADECDELMTGSGLMKISRMVVWDELVKYLPHCWIDLLQEHVRDCNATRQFQISTNPRGPCPTITCKCSLPGSKCH